MAEARRELAELTLLGDIEYRIDADMRLPAEVLRRFYDVTGGTIEEIIKLKVPNPISLDLVSFDKHVDARILTGKGVVHALIPRRRLSPSNPHILLVWMAATSVALVGVALLFLRNQTKPIRELAAAATAFGRGRSLSFRPRGAEEVRRAGAAFLDMRARIERQIESRTRMLSASPMTCARRSRA